MNMTFKARDKKMLGRLKATRTPSWFRDRDTWAFVGRLFLPWMTLLNLTWEVLQLPLYTIWSDAPATAIASAVMHCTLGDVFVALACLWLALIVGREGPVARWHWWRIGVVVVILGVSYTVFSEWSNTALQRWTYSGLMPTLNVARIEIGLSPLLQWIALPPIALFLSYRSMRRRIVPRSSHRCN